MSTKIGNKLFSYFSCYDYVQQHADTIRGEYPNSIVLIGDEQMLWQPLTNSYVGVPYSKFAYAYNLAIPDLQERMVEIEKQGNIISKIDIDGTSSPTAQVTPNLSNEIGLITVNTAAAGNAYQLITVSGQNSDITLDSANAYNFILDQIEEAKKYAVTNSIATSDNIYKLLLGDDSTYIEHEATEFVKENTYTGDYDIFYNGDIYGKLDGNYQKIRFVKTNDGWKVYIDRGNATVDPNDEIGDYDPATGTFDINSNNTNRWEIENGENLVLYTLNNTTQNSYNMNITQGIETLKEVAYILDVITDGSQDAGISLAYNIAYNNQYIDATNDRIDDIVAGSVENVNSLSLSNPLSVITTSSKANYTGNVVTYNSIKTAIIGANKEAYWSSAQYGNVEGDILSYVQILPTTLSDAQINELYNTNSGLFVDSVAGKPAGTFIPVSQGSGGTWGKDTSSPSKYLLTHQPVIQKDGNTIDVEGTNNDLVTTVSWVLSYVDQATAGIKQDMDSLDVNDKIQKYLAGGTYVTYTPYTIDTLGGANDSLHVVKSIPTSFASYFITKDDAANTVEFVTFAGEEYNIVKDEINISLSSTYSSDIVESSSTYGYQNHALAYTVHDVTLHTQTLQEASESNATYTYNGFALAYDVASTIEAMFTWYDVSSGDPIVDNWNYNNP